MTSKHKRVVFSKLFWASILDKTTLSAQGVIRVIGKWQYLLSALAIMLISGIILGLTSTGSASWNLLLSSLPIADKLGVIGQSLTGLIQGAVTPYGLIVLLIILLQGITLSLAIFNITEQRQVNKKRKSTVGTSEPILATIIATLGVGCSTCGTSLIAPLIGALAGSAALLGAITTTMLALATTLLLHSLWSLGYSAYMFTCLSKSRAVNE